MRHPGYIVLALLGLAVVLLIVGQRLMRTKEPEIQAFAEEVETHPMSGEEVRVIDGDTIAIGDERIRLFGIDAPEDSQTCSQDGRSVRCGDEATAYLQALIGRRQVNCEGEDRDRYGRLIAVCSIDGNDIGRQMVRSGWAVAFREYSDEYVSDENAARSERRGLWQGGFQLPSEWRSEH